ncbi:MAG TPA: 50S ribosomal protein L22 [Candidatus Acidoferrales bacterium]|nr:50S ribosomal protein L22 [Candidatus Acidoferrales bacterium]
MATATPAQGQIEGVAQAKFIRVSPQKARLVVDLIRGRSAEEALQTLQFTKKRVAREIEKTLRSAIANAERKADDAGESLDVDALVVSRCFVNEGSRWKRLRPAPMGRGFRYQKRTAHIVVEVAEHHRAAADRVAAAKAEAEASKGVRGAVRKARKAIEDRAKQVKKQK